MLNIYANVITRQQMETQSQTTQNTPASAQRVTPIDTVLVQFVRLLPYDAARTAYRKAQLTLHPDAGGDSNKASALNVAWQRIEKEIYGQ